jgi:hypothetical protein
VLSRKDYVAVAAMLSSEREHARNLADGRERASVDALARVARELALIFKQDNPRFNAGKFFDAAGFPELTGSRMGLN